MAPLPRNLSLPLQNVNREAPHSLARSFLEGQIRKAFFLDAEVQELISQMLTVRQQSPQSFDQWLDVQKNALSSSLGNFLNISQRTHLKTPGRLNDLHEANCIPPPSPRVAIVTDSTLRTPSNVSDSFTRNNYVDAAALRSTPVLESDLHTQPHVIQKDIVIPKQDSKPDGALHSVTKSTTVVPSTTSIVNKFSRVERLVKLHCTAFSTDNSNQKLLKACSDVFSKNQVETLTCEKFETLILPLLKIGKLMSHTFFSRICPKGKNRIRLSELQEALQTHFILGHDEEPSNVIFNEPEPTILEPTDDDEHNSASNKIEFKYFCVRNFFYAVKKKTNDFIEVSDLKVYLSEILDRSENMQFLKEYTDFHTRYCETVIVRILFELDKTDSERIYLRDLQHSFLPHIWCNLSETTLINCLYYYFSYENFYVASFLLSELDRDRDLLLNAEDLARYDNYALNPFAAQRVWSLLEWKGYTKNSGYLTFRDWVWFLLMYEDMTSDRSMDFWFDVIDIDGDGSIRDHEILPFFEEQLVRLSSYGLEEVTLCDWIAQMNDAINPRRDGCFYLSDLKKNRKAAATFFGTLVSFSKWVHWEQRDAHREQEIECRYKYLSPWNVFCALKYEEITATHQSGGEELDDAAENESNGEED